MQELVSIVPCTSTTRREPARRCRRSMFCVITASSMPRARGSASASCARVRLLVGEHPEPRPVEGPEPLRVAPEHVDVRDLHRVDVLPQAGARASGSPGIPLGTEMPAPVSATVLKEPRSSSASRSVPSGAPRPCSPFALCIWVPHAAEVSRLAPQWAGGGTGSFAGLRLSQPGRWPSTSCATRSSTAPDGTRARLPGALVPSVRGVPRRGAVAQCLPALCAVAGPRRRRGGHRGVQPAVRAPLGRAPRPR